MTLVILIYKCQDLATHSNSLLPTHLVKLLTIHKVPFLDKLSHLKTQTVYLVKRSVLLHRLKLRVQYLVRVNSNKPSQAYLVNQLQIQYLVKVELDPKANHKDRVKNL